MTSLVNTPVSPVPRLVAMTGRVGGALQGLVRSTSWLRGRGAGVLVVLPPEPRLHELIKDASRHMDLNKMMSVREEVFFTESIFLFQC